MRDFVNDSKYLGAYTLGSLGTGVGGWVSSVLVDLGDLCSCFFWEGCVWVCGSRGSGSGDGTEQSFCLLDFLDRVYTTVKQSRL